MTKFYEKIVIFDGGVKGSGLALAEIDSSMNYGSPELIGDAVVIRFYVSCMGVKKTEQEINNTIELLKKYKIDYRIAKIKV